MKTVKDSAMKKTECLSLVSLAVTGVLYGAPNAIALPLLDSDLASFTGLGASVRSSTPEDASGDTAGAHGINAAHASSTAGGPEGNGNPVATSAGSGNSGYPAAWTNPGYLGRGNPWATPDQDDAIRHPGVNGLAAKPDKPSVVPGPDDGNIAKDKDLCGRLLANNGGVTLDQDRLADFCADVSNEGGAPETAGNDGLGGNDPLASLIGDATAPDSDSDEAAPETAGNDGLGGNDALTSLIDDATEPDSASDEAASDSVSDEALTLAPALLVLPEPEVGRAAVPEPATLALLLAGGVGLVGVGGGVRRGRRTKNR